MKPIVLGDVEVHRIEEMIWPVPVQFLFPQLPENALEPYRDWLVPYFSSDLAAPDMRLSIHGFVIKTPHHTILVDACVGNDKDRAYPEWQRMQTDFLQKMAAVGAAPDQVDYVFCTHFHGDHVGWNTKLDKGRWVPTFPNARYLFHRPEFEYWMGLPDDERPVQVTDSVVPIVEAKQYDLVESDFGIDDCVHLEPTPGHTPGHCSVHLGAGGREAVITGDMIHHPSQVVRPEWYTRACTDPDKAIATRTAFLEKYADTDVRVLGSHFASPTACRIRGHGDGFHPDFGQN